MLLVSSGLRRRLATQHQNTFFNRPLDRWSEVLLVSSALRRRLATQHHNMCFNRSFDRSSKVLLSSGLRTRLANGCAKLGKKHGNLCPTTPNGSSQDELAFAGQHLLVQHDDHKAVGLKALLVQKHLPKDSGLLQVLRRLNCFRR